MLQALLDSMIKEARQRIREVRQRISEGNCPAVPDFKTRVIEERDQLVEKLTKLSDFIAGPTFASLHEIDRRLLHDQLDAMRDYSRILNERIVRFDAIETKPSAGSQSGSQLGSHRLEKR